MAGKAPQRGGRRRWGLALGVALLGFACGVVLALERHAIASRLVSARLERAGLVEATLEVARFDWGRLELRGLRAGGDALAVEWAEARWSLSGLWARRLDALRVRGLRLTGALSGEHLRFGSLEAPSDGAEAPAVPPVALLELEDARLEIETPSGRWEASARGRLEFAAPSDLAGEVEFRARHPRGEAHGRLAGRGAPDALEGTLDADLWGRGDPALGVEGAARASLRALWRLGSGVLEVVPVECLDTRVSALELAEAARLAAPVRMCLGEAGQPLLRLRSPDGELRLEATLLVPPAPFALELGAGPTRLEGQTPRLSLHAEGPVGQPSLRVGSQGGELRVPQHALGASGLGLGLEIDPASGWPRGSLRLAEIRDLATPARFAALALEGELRPEAGGLAFRVTVSDPDRLLVVEASGVHDPGTGAGRAGLALAPISFEPGALEPEQLFPALGDRVDDVSGSLEALGSVAWSGGPPSGVLDLAVRELSAATELADVERLNAAIRLDGLWPPSTPAEQLVSMARLDFGLEFVDGLVAFQLRPDGILELASAEWSFAGGLVTTSGILDPEAEEQELVFLVEDLDLAALFELANLGGLRGEGSLSGEVPVALGPGGVEIRQAVLRASPPGGWIRYRPDERVRQLARGRSGLDLLLEALENLRYETLEVGLDGEADGVVGLRLQLRGRNPDLEAGRPLEFDLELEGALGDLLGASLAEYRIPERITERLEEFTRRRSE